MNDEQSTLAKGCRFTPPGATQPCGAEPAPGKAIVMTFRSHSGTESQVRLPLCEEHAAFLAGHSPAVSLGEDA